MDNGERSLRRAVRSVAALVMAGAVLACLFALLGIPAFAWEPPDSGAVIPAALPAGGPESAAAATWNEFSPTGWVTVTQVTAGVSVTDTDGLQDLTAQYRYSTDGGGSWVSWGQANLIVTGPTTTTKRLTVTNLYMPDSATNNYFMFRILDGAAITETSSSYLARVDSTKPGSSVTTSGWFKTLSSIAGTASDATSGVARVDIRVQRSSDGKYYNGFDWQPNPIWLLASGTTSWNYAFTPTETINYAVASRATDNAGLVQTSYGTGTISFDNVIPASAVGTNGFYRTATWTGAITGTASDVGSGVQQVEITVRRAADGMYFNGSDWQVGSA